MTFRLLLSGHDTIECAYYLAPSEGCLLDYERLAVEKEILRQSKSRKPMLIKLGSEEFMLAGHGTGSGYPFLIENEAFSIQFGEFNNPSFFVTFRSIALWHQSAQGLHERIMAWAASVGLRAYLPERLSRVDTSQAARAPNRQLLCDYKGARGRVVCQLSVTGWKCVVKC